jgi:anti-sigma B factor antagonist
MITESKTRQIEPDITVVEISGRLGMGNVLVSIESAVRRLIEEGARKLIVDLAGLNHIDSAGMGALMACGGLIEQKGGRMRVAGARGVVAKAFDIIHMDRIVGLNADVESACRALAGDGAAV